MSTTEQRALQAASEYLRTHEGQDPAEYELTFEVSGPGRLVTVEAVHRDDLQPDVAPGAGSGKSLELQIDPDGGFSVVSALGFQ